MELFDLHADTASRILREGLAFSDPALQCSRDALRVFSPYTQVFTFFSNPAESNEEAYRSLFAQRSRLLAALSPYLSSSFSYILAVEDARLLNGRPERLNTLFTLGVRILTLLWRGETVIGGSFDTAVGLTPFGKEITRLCYPLGILPDVSHASVPSFWEIAEIAAEKDRPFLATHSNARAVCDHPRNLTNDQFRAVVQAGGLVGLSLCPAHLRKDENATSADLLAHLDHYLSLGGEDTVAIGSDFDGIDTTPADLPNTASLSRLREAMEAAGYSRALIRKLFYQNAYQFFQRYQI